VDAFDLVSYMVGGSALIVLIWGVRQSVEASRHPMEGQLAEALASLSPIERWLFQGVLRRNLARPGSRLSKSIPRYGLRGATQLAVAQSWLIVIYLAWPSVILQGASVGTARQWAGRILLGVGVIALTFSSYRGASGARAGRRYRRGGGTVGQRPAGL
jgi:hypothetical protein